MKRTRIFALLLCGSLLFSSASFAQTDVDFESIDTLLEDNQLTEAANRYASVMLSFFPERATRLGYSSANSKLNDRSAQTNALALGALRSVKEITDQIKKDQLSAANQPDLELLQNTLNADIWSLEQNRIENDPLYYAEVFDAIYDVMLKKMTSTAQQKADLAARVNALPAVAAQAEKNLVQPPAFLSQQAMEKAYYAYLAFDEVTDFLLQGVEDDISIAQIKQNGQNAKRAIKQMFDLFKRLSQEKDTQDFRLGADNYTRVLADRYQIEVKPSKLEKQLAKEFTAAQKELAQALEPFALDTAEEEVTVIDDPNGTPDVQEIPQEKKQKAKKGKYVPPTAQDFYKAAARVQAAPSGGDLIAELTQDANQLASFFSQDGTLPASRMRFSVKPMPAFYAYFQAYLFMPPFGEQYAPTTDLFLRLPSGNKLARQEQLQRDFNMPVRKLLLCGELVPGRYYQTVAGSQLSAIRRLYPSVSSANGWSAYAQQLAARRGYISSDEERLFLAWTNYRRAAAALADVHLQTKQYTYADALNFLVTENGFAQEEAEILLKEIAARPGEAASYIYGLNAFEATYNAFRKKWGKQFSPARFHALLLQAGNVPPDQLQQEAERLDKKAKLKAKQKEKKEKQENLL